MSRVVTGEHVREHRTGSAFSLPGAALACWLMLGVTVVVAGYFSGNADWWRFSICAFGAAEKSSMPWLFNIGVLATSMLTVSLAAREYRALAGSCARGILAAWERHLVVGVTLVLASQLAVVGFVPYDLGRTAWLIHNFAAWGAGCLLSLGMLVVALAPRDFGPRFRVMTWLMLAAVFALFALFQLGRLPYAVAEIAGLLCCAMWTIRYFAALEGLGDG